jgi:hypothetical protein
MVGGRLRGSPCLQRADEGHTIVNALGRPPTPPNPRPPRDLGTPLSRRPNPCPGRGSHGRGGAGVRPQDISRSPRAAASSTGSPGNAKTIGTLFVACFAARAHWVPYVIIKSTFSWTSSAAKSRRLRSSSRVRVAAERRRHPLARDRSRGRAQKANGRQLSGLLRARRARPRGRSAERG